MTSKYNSKGDCEEQRDNPDPNIPPTVWVGLLPTAFVADLFCDILLYDAFMSACP
jgi:hypothetical protein